MKLATSEQQTAAQVTDWQKRQERGKGDRPFVPHPRAVLEVKKLVLSHDDVTAPAIHSSPHTCTRRDPGSNDRPQKSAVRDKGTRARKRGAKWVLAK